LSPGADVMTVVAEILDELDAVSVCVDLSLDCDAVAFLVPTDTHVWLAVAGISGQTFPCHTIALTSSNQLPERADPGGAASCGATPPGCRASSRLVEPARLPGPGGIPCECEHFER
jgi:hypothetical protein